MTKKTFRTIQYGLMVATSSLIFLWLLEYLDPQWSSGHNKSPLLEQAKALLFLGIFTGTIFLCRQTFVQFSQDFRSMETSADSELVHAFDVAIAGLMIGCMLMLVVMFDTSATVAQAVGYTVAASILTGWFLVRLFQQREPRSV